MGKFSRLLVNGVVLLVFIASNNQVFATMQDEQPQSNKPSTEQKKPADDKKTEENRETAPDVKRSDMKIAPPLDPTELQISDINHYLDEQLIEPILVGPEQHISLIETNATSNSKGVMVLLADWQQSATSPKAINYLRQSMPQHGWTTISIQPTPKPAAYPSTAQPLNQRNEENSKTITQYNEQLAKILTAITEKAKNYPGIIVMVAEGRHGALLLTQYQQQLTEPPNALVILSAYIDDAHTNQQSAEHLAQTDLPVLDLYLRTDQRLIKSSVALRKKYVNKELKSYYRQKELFNTHTGYYPETALTKTINGWLKSLGW
ncbi:DUF3530 family protein [Thalassotalea sp. G2M2-11]|uniref:DUF3530 family protein n=1 Tax=Thalassotalea sp. G2M2-11 TaxID=2787627 RepID=UPI0019D0F485|nr:DUF3530 family protein [Thalassotalea sp. G2M2-11]